MRSGGGHLANSLIVHTQLIVETQLNSLIEDTQPTDSRDTTQLIVDTQLNGFVR